MNSLKRSMLAAVSVAALLLPGATVAGAEDVKIGFLGGFTGPIESLVPPIAGGAQLAVKHVNDQGGILGGRNLVMPTGDSTCGDVTAAANAADRLVNSDQVLAIVGPLCSGALISSVNNAAIPGGAVTISPAATSPAITALKDNDLVFRTVPSDAFQGLAMAKLLRAKGVKRIAVTYVNNDYGKGFAQALEAAFAARGGEVTVSLAHEDGKADYRAELGALASSGADMLAVLAYADGSGQTVIRQALEGGDFAKFVVGDGMVSDKLIKAVGADNLSGLIGTKPGQDELPGSAIFARLAKTAKLDPTGVFVAQSYDAAFLLALAVEKNGAAKREGLNAALRAVASAPGEVILPGEWAKAKKLISQGKAVNYEGASGLHEFDQAGDVPGFIMEMTIKGGSFAEVGIIR